MAKYDPKRGGLLTRKRIHIRDKRLREIELLKKAKWKKRKGLWINPRSGRAYDEYLAIAIEELHRSLSKRTNI